jgi:hypothetical protein
VQPIEKDRMEKMRRMKKEGRKPETGGGDDGDAGWGVGTSFF